jgi:AP-1-like factor
MLTPQQQTLLFAALNSQKASNGASNALSLSPSTYAGSPTQKTDGNPGAQESPYLDYDYEFGGADSSFDFSFDDNAKMIGDLPGASGSSASDSPDKDNSDKRSHPDDDDDEELGAKRRESEDKVAKKPGRKPLTTEPSSVSYQMKVEAQR